MVRGLASGLFLANHLALPVVGLTQGPSWWCASLSQDGFQREGFWEGGRTYFLLPPPFGPS